MTRHFLNTPRVLPCNNALKTGYRVGHVNLIYSSKGSVPLHLKNAHSTQPGILRINIFSITGELSRNIQILVTEGVS